MRVISVALVTLTVAAALLMGCNDREFITVHDHDPARPIGGACTVDAECSSNRCIAGICKDNGCGNDGDCRTGEICVFEVCQPETDFACKPDQAPLMSIAPSLNVDFGDVVIGQTGSQVVKVSNVGDCLLTLSAVDLAQGSTPGFTCDPCDASTYPQRIPPQQELDITVKYSPVNPGDATGTLLIHGDDQTAGDQGLVSVALHAAYDGVPALVIDPPELDFGYVPFTAGGAAGSSTQNITITNRGTGNAALTIDRMFVDHGIEFTIPAEFDAYTPDAPLIVPPYDPNDASTIVTVPVTFTPDGNDNYNDKLIVKDVLGNVVPCALAGSSLGPPEISVSTADITFKCGVDNPLIADACPTNDAYPVGQVTFRQFTITNSGQSNLNVSFTLGGDAGDFTVSPSFIPPIAPGGVFPVEVAYAPSTPSDLGSPLNPQHSVDAVLNITSNDNDPATDVLKSIALHGFAKSTQGDQTLKLDMQFETADNSWAGNDFRSVDLALDSPTGFTCTRPLTTCVSNGNGTCTPQFAPNGDLCGEWNSFGQDGQVAWIPLGAYQNPQRVLLFGLGPTGDEGGTFTAKVTYIEDCDDIPTGLLADILGISGTILLGALGGSIGVPIAVPPDQIAQQIENNCFSHDGSTVTLHVSLNGTEVAAPQHRLDHRGDVFEMAHLKRTSGLFCDPNIGIDCP